MKFSYRLFREGGDVLLAISDATIIGKTFEEGELNITVSRDFYSEKLCDEDEAVKLIRKATIVNAVGKEIISLMLSKKLLESGMILKIAGVPHAQVVTVK
jgi:hypothetical protein